MQFFLKRPLTHRPGFTSLAALSVAALLTAAPGAQAQDADDSAANPVVAVVNGHEITYDEIRESAEELPQQYQSQFDRIFPQLLDRMVDMRLLLEEARDKGLADDPEVKDRVAEAREQILGQVMLERKSEDFVTEERMRQAYEAYKSNNPPQKQVRARHILVEEESKARDLIAQLDDGADFVDLAGEHSTGPSGKRGGDLGYFGPGEMVKPFSEAAFSLEPGSHTADPVKSEFGWHVIKVEDKRTQQAESFESMKPELRKQVRQQATQEVLSEIRDGHEVETYPERRPGAK